MIKNHFDSNEDQRDKTWESINWSKVNKSVKKLRGLIYDAKRNGKLERLRRLQEILLKSNSNIVSSIRKISSINVGKKTPGLDKQLIKGNKDRTQLFYDIKSLSISDMVEIAKPVRRIYIPKPNGKVRPLGIPTIKDRVIQNMVRNILEPEWEAVFESSSYGFRPKRSCHDALSRIYATVARQKTRLWVLDADIRGCFDNISHEYLLNVLDNFPAKDLIKTWLKAGYVEFPSYDVIENPVGTPQGGVISPLLANIALHGMEKALGIKTVSTTGHNYGNNKFAVVRYADDFVVLAKSEQDCIDAKMLLSSWLKVRGLEFAPDKVAIRHLKEGFSFLGCYVRLFRDKKLFIMPDPKKVHKFKHRLKELWLQQKGQAPKSIISILNPIISGWSQYYAPFVSSDIFSDLDHYMWHRAWRYSVRRHPNKGHKWVAEKYFSAKPNSPSKNKWRFFGFTINNDKLFLNRFLDTKIVRHVMVKNNMNPDCQSIEAREYWDKREAMKSVNKWKNLAGREKIAKKQYHLCPMCDESLYIDEDLHLHHIIQKKDGGTDTYGNIILLHELCHRQVHSLKLKEEDIRDKIAKLRKRMKAKLSAKP